MPLFCHSISIAAAPERVWPVLADVEHWPDWTPTMRRVRWLGPLPPDAGTKAEVVQLWPTIWQITRWEPPVGFDWISSSPGMKMTARHWLTADNDGCQLDVQFQLDGPGAWLGRFLFQAMIRRYLKLEAEGLKRHIETEDRN